jgi:hypothetical protein
MDTEQKKDIAKKTLRYSWATAKFLGDAVDWLLSVSLALIAVLRTSFSIVRTLLKMVISLVGAISGMLARAYRRAGDKDQN